MKQQKPSFFHQDEYYKIKHFLYLGRPLDVLYVVDEWGKEYYLNTKKLVELLVNADVLGPTDREFKVAEGSE